MSSNRNDVIKTSSIPYERRTPKKASFSTSDVATIFILRFRFADIKTSPIPYEVCDGGRHEGRTPDSRFDARHARPKYSLPYFPPNTSYFHSVKCHHLLSPLHDETASEKLLFRYQKCVMVVVDKDGRRTDGLQGAAPSEIQPPILSSNHFIFQLYQVSPPSLSSS